MVKKNIDKYQLNVNGIIVDVKISYDDQKSVPDYVALISNISDTTKIILEKIRQEFITKQGVIGMTSDVASNRDIREKFKKDILRLIGKYFPKTDEKTANMLMNYLLQESVGYGKLEILLKDENLEELVINSSKEPIWVYHKKHGWLKTNITIPTESRIRHFSTMIAREVGKEITNLNPILDAHLRTGDRVNATLMPISNFGNTMTIRKFAADPWTITKFLKIGTITPEAAALVWLAMENELSIIVAGGTGSGKTSMLNCIANFFPPDQRILSIEDTRELVLPKNLHWVPMETRAANPEGKGGISMLDLVVNSLRQRPDRILVGEIRRKEEAQVLLEAMHTGHSVYGTFHANSAEETVMRLTNPPIEIPKPTLSAVGFLLIQNRNRRNGKRRTLQIAEITEEGDARVVMQLDAISDKMNWIREPSKFYEHLNLFTGMTPEDVKKNLSEKVKILNWMKATNVEDVNNIGLVMAQYYRRAHEK